MFNNHTKLEKLFRFISYGTAISGLLCLFTSGSIGVLIFAIFVIVTVLAWFLENSKWQLSERVGVILIFLIIPLFFIDWKYHISGITSRDAFAAGSLSIMILSLASIKLLQKKVDRDWIFLYLISFFEILLAAGVSISPLFLSSLILYLLFAFSSIILFEIRKTSNSINNLNYKNKSNVNSSNNKSQFFRLPVTSFIILILIAIFAVPLFFAFPRVGGAGFGNSLSGLTGFTGFSDSVRLGEIGKLQQSNEVVMRVRINKNADKLIQNYYWRGIALDYFDNQSWRKSKIQTSEPFVKTERDFFLIDAPKDSNNLVIQTIYLEPIDTPVLFALSRPVALQGNFQLLNKDAEGSINTQRNGWERISYKVFSDVTLPPEKQLRDDNSPYSSASNKYLQLPDNLDARISKLTEDIIKQSKTKNRYDQAQAVEHYLQNNFKYSLDLKAGGKDPLADFLFNIKEGHCEYFASAMAIMLRTQGIATRIVNGFQSGEYNETADVYVVRQKEAHSWVEVYFPTEKVWVPFDPTASADESESAATGFTNQFNKYIEAMETFWIQYVVSYDNQEQRSLFKSVRTNLTEYQNQATDWFKSSQDNLAEWWKNVRGENGVEESIKAMAFGIGYLLASILGIFIIIWLLRKIKRVKIWKLLREYFRREKENSIVEFYERMQKILAKQGFKRESSQTPLEFAFALNMPEAIKVTEKYNRVRFGEKNLSNDEAREIENWLKSMDKDKKI